MENNTQVELIVLLDEIKEVKGIFEVENEICELIDYHIVDIAKDIQEHFTVDEQLFYHFDSLGKLSKFYNSAFVNESDVSEFLKIYNEIASVKLNYELVTVKDEVEMQEFISYVNEIEDGYQKYKDNNYQIPNQTIIVHHPEDIQNSQVYKKNVHQIDEIIERIVIVELNRLKNVQIENILEDKSSYLMSLLEIYQDLEENRFLDKSSNDLLIRLKELFDDEYELLGVEIKIEYSNKPISENKDSSNVATFEHVIKK